MTIPNIAEIRQLRYVSEQYIGMARAIEVKIKKTAERRKLFKTLTVRKLGQIWKSEKNPDANIKTITRYLAHLSSAAVRMYAIDEQIRDHAPRGSARWKEYESDKRSSAKLTKLGEYIHILLRLNAAHSEEPSKSGYQILTTARKPVIEGLKVSGIKGLLEKAFASIKKDIKRLKWE